jgi:Histidine phosphatase superfamily (branch 1)
MASTQLYLVRHGEQDPASGHAADGGLSQLGREQADRLGWRLRTVPFSTIHHSPLARAAQTAGVIAGHLPQVPRHACDLVADRTPVPSAGQRDRYPDRWLAWLDGVPGDERDEDARALQAAADLLVYSPGKLNFRTNEASHSALVPHHEDVDGILALDGEAVALVQGLGAASPQHVQPERAVAAVAVEQPLQDPRPDSLALAAGPQIEVLDPQRARVRAHRDGACLPAAD